MILQKHKSVLLLLSRLTRSLSQSRRIGLLDHFRMTTGVKGLAIRWCLLKATAAACGDNVSVHPCVYTLNPPDVSLGDNVSIQPMSYIEVGGGVSIGDDISIAHGVSIPSTSHRFTGMCGAIKDQGVVSREIVMEDGLSVGAKASVLVGRTISRGAIIGAGAVVTRGVGQDYRWWRPLCADR